MQYLVTAPTPEYTGLVAGVAFAAGRATVDDSSPGVRRALGYFRRRGYRVEPAPVAVSAEQPDPEPVDPLPPARSASKTDWVRYAVSQGMTDADADAMTRDQLAEAYLGPKEA